MEGKGIGRCIGLVYVSMTSQIRLRMLTCVPSEASLKLNHHHIPTYRPRTSTCTAANLNYRLYIYLRVLMGKKLLDPLYTDEPEEHYLVVINPWGMVSNRQRKQWDIDCCGAWLRAIFGLGPGLVEAIYVMDTVRRTDSCHETLFHIQLFVAGRSYCTTGSRSRP